MPHIPHIPHIPHMSYMLFMYYIIIKEQEAAVAAYKNTGTTLAVSNHPSKKASPRMTSDGSKPKSK